MVKVRKLVMVGLLCAAICIGFSMPMLTSAQEERTLEEAFALLKTAMPGASEMKTASAAAGERTRTDMAVFETQHEARKAGLLDGQSVSVSTFTELKEALETVKPAKVVLSGDITMEDTILIDSDVRIVSDSASSLACAAGKRHFNVEGADILIVFENVVLEGANIGGGIHSDADKLTLDGAVVQNGYHNQYPSYYGVGVYAEYALNLISCDIFNNVGTSFGGGVYVAYGDTLVYQTRINGNSTTASDSVGGGILVGIGLFELYESEVVGNYAPIFGGGVLMYYDVDCYIKNTNISENESYMGGGILCFSNMTLLEGTIISKNVGEAGAGVVFMGDNFSMEAGEIENNHANLMGGGIMIMAGLRDAFGMPLGNAWISGGTIRNNTAEDGAGIYLASEKYKDHVGIATLEISGGVISFNTAIRNGGGICTMSYDSENNITMTGGNIYQNTAENGGGLYLTDNTDFYASGGDIRFNSAAAGGGIYNDAKAVLNGARVLDNQGTLGGGIYSSLNSDTTVSAGAVDYNYADEGGGIYAKGALMLSGGTVSANIAMENGGGIFADRFSMIGGTISYNSTKHGGGVYYTGAFEMNGGVITKNVATYYGGGIYGDADSIATLRNGSIAGNLAREDGEDIYSLGTVA